MFDVNRIPFPSCKAGRAWGWPLTSSNAEGENKWSHTSNPLYALTVAQWLLLTFTHLKLSNTRREEGGGGQRGVECTGPRDNWNECKVLVRKRQKWRSSCSWKDNMKMDLKYLRFQGVEWMQLDNNKGPVAGSCGHLGSIHKGKYLGRVSVAMSYYVTSYWHAPLALCWLRGPFGKYQTINAWAWQGVW